MCCTDALPSRRPRRWVAGRSHARIDASRDVAVQPSRAGTTISALPDHSGTKSVRGPGDTAQIYLSRFLRWNPWTPAAYPGLVVVEACWMTNEGCLRATHHTGQAEKSSWRPATHSM